ncbi:MAG: hypothetical protein H7123_04410 [Thermoleophilia bacterium]|nr:hypothetical protein [Thermoleophilia bacterium]
MMPAILRLADANAAQAGPVDCLGVDHATFVHDGNFLSVSCPAYAPGDGGVCRTGARRGASLDRRIGCATGNRE